MSNSPQSITPDITESLSPAEPVSTPVFEALPTEDPIVNQIEESLNPAEPVSTPVFEALPTEDPIVNQTEESLDPAGPVSMSATELLSTEKPMEALSIDPITGNEYSNTSNGNQVAVLSTIDYSTSNALSTYSSATNTALIGDYLANSNYSADYSAVNNYSADYSAVNNYSAEYSESKASSDDYSVNSTLSTDYSIGSVVSTIDYSTTNVIYSYSFSSILGSQGYSQGSGPGRSEDVNAIENQNTPRGQSCEYSSGPIQNAPDDTNSELHPLLSAASSGTVADVPVNISLQRKSLHLRFWSDAYFGRQGVRRIDRVIGFDGENGDKIQLSRRVFKGIGGLEFKSVANREQLRRVSKSNADIIYQELTGQLFFNANGDAKGFGNQGGMFAILESMPFLNADYFLLI